MKLDNRALHSLPAGISGPNYDRASLTAGIVHIGVGNFHRAHQAWYLHRLMQKGQAKDWAIIGAGVRPYDENQRSKLAAQDYLTTLAELDPAGTTAEIIGSMIGYIPIQSGNQALVRQMADPAIRIVSLTVTEGGYCLDPATKRFDPSNDDIRFDAAHPESPRTAFGAIVAALRMRREAGIGPFTCLSCDNLPGNGLILGQVVIGLAKLSDPDLAAWIEDAVSFPNSMVDCIVPATGDAELELVHSLGIDDMAPVTHENFRQWVIEDDFCAGRPPLEDVGVTISNDVHTYEAMKLRLLNGGHQVIANAAEILGLSTISESIRHPLINGLFRKVAIEEVAPHLQAVPGMQPEQYVDLIEKRFANAELVDTVRRVAFDGASRHTGAVLPAVRDALLANTSISGLALTQALWARMCVGVREDGSSIAANDPIWSALTKVAQDARTTPRAWLEQRHLYGDIADNADFSAAFEHWLSKIYSQGTEATLAAYIG